MTPNMYISVVWVKKKSQPTNPFYSNLNSPIFWPYIKLPDNELHCSVQNVPGWAFSGAPQ